MGSFTGVNGALERSAVSKRSNLRLRILTSLVLAPVVLAAIYVGGAIYACTIALVIGLGFAEWLSITLPNERGLLRDLAIGMSIALVLATAAVGMTTGLVLLAAMQGLLLLALGFRGGAAAALGLVYLGAFALALLWIRSSGTLGGFWTVAWLVILVWATDIGGYIFGRWIGGPKLAPVVSPNKTWAGLIGGAGLALVTGLALLPLAGLAMPVWGVAALAVCLAVVAQGGDLFESAIKRRFGVKDSGTIIPGHGGVLDRVDGLIAAAPTLALLHLGFGIL